MSRKAKTTRAGGLKPQERARLYAEVKANAAACKADHPQTHIAWGGQEADVDSDIADLIRACWQAGIDTCSSCQNAHEWLPDGDWPSSDRLVVVGFSIEGGQRFQRILGDQPRRVAPDAISLGEVIPYKQVPAIIARLREAAALGVVCEGGSSVGTRR